MFKITSDIPIYAISNKQGRPPVYPWASMEVGDSFLAEGKAIGRMSPVAHARAANHPGEKYACRTVDGGVRVWRVA